jgi:hypothetical protein
MTLDIDYFLMVGSLCLKGLNNLITKGLARHLDIIGTNNVGPISNTSCYMNGKTIQWDT